MKFIKSLKGEDDGTQDPVQKKGKSFPSNTFPGHPPGKDKGQFNLPPSDKLMKKNKRM
jgi:hypothetical protein